MEQLNEATGRRRRRRGASKGRSTTARKVDYRRLRNPFTPQTAFSDDRIAAMHQTALRVLEELGIKVLLPEARALYKAGGARVDEATEMVTIGRDMVEAALASAPRSFVLHGAVPERDLPMELGALAFQSGAGAPNVTDLERGRRPGQLADAIELTKLVQHFDAIQMLSPGVEPQDVEPALRHYAFAAGPTTGSPARRIVTRSSTPTRRARSMCRWRRD